MFAGRTEGYPFLISLYVCVYKMTLPSSVRFVWSTRRRVLLREPGFFAMLSCPYSMSFAICVIIHK